MRTTLTSSPAPPAAGSASHAPPTEPAGSPSPLTCPHCGGSGILRMGDQQFRTCLECLGQGQLPSAVQQELHFSPAALRPCVSHAR
jgi:hypothetical protein